GERARLGAIWDLAIPHHRPDGGRRQIGVSEPHPERGAVYWLELRPSEGGRHVLVRATDDGRILDVTPSGTNVRTRVHEYGGGAFLVKGETVFFSNFEDQRLYRLDGDGQPGPSTP